MLRRCRTAAAMLLSGPVSCELGRLASKLASSSCWAELLAWPPDARKWRPGWRRARLLEVDERCESLVSDEEIEALGEEFLLLWEWRRGEWLSARVSSMEAFCSSSL